MIARRLIAAVVFTAVFAALPAGAQQLLPRVESGDITYLGGFAVPNSSSGPPNEGSRAGFGGGGLSIDVDPATGRKLLVFGGHSHRIGYFAKVELPDSYAKSGERSNLPMARIATDFVDLIGSQLATLGDTGSGAHLGTLVWNGRLIVGGSLNYADDAAQLAAIGARSRDFSKSDFPGFVPVVSAYTNYKVSMQRVMAGYMTPIPSEWRGLFGGPVLSGKCCLSVISSSSAGPAASVVNPDDVGVRNPVPATTVVAYPSGNPVCSMTGKQNCMDGNGVANEVFNLTTKIVGIAFPSGTRSVLFFGRHGTGPYCYNQPPQTCDDPMYGDIKGGHAYPYRFQVWAYDANDLLQVKAGAKQPWQVFPYAVWEMPELGAVLAGKEISVTGGTFDPGTGRFYLTTAFGEAPRVEVFQIKLQPRPEVPTNMRAN